VLSKNSAFNPVILQGVLDMVDHRPFGGAVDPLHELTFLSSGRDI
jgi:hypothetical protein